MIKCNWLLLSGMILIASSYLVFKLIGNNYFTNEYYFMSTCAGGAIISSWILVNAKLFPMFYKKFSINFLVYFCSMFFIFLLDYGFKINTMKPIQIICLITALCSTYLLIRLLLKYIPQI
jgi:hypothetical protein